MVEARDLVEGRYTLTAPAVAGERAVHGQYTRRAEQAGPRPEVVGAYVGTQHDGIPPIVRSVHLRNGNYPRAEHERTEP
ncbi:hypothetical protein P5G50_15080 [Leifsonia sp. F6_8S_P_1B]|uniref:Uncharacterized protein n=1 Tax=Leifsonia williamsii TaxID=3035919 RepID=A0ABT8KEA5_9MICO|nr:hypothetical protein [Leifsonia williamsii]MDN4615774.1 hypothetical protein [Leifsonia williamsii]